MKIIKRSSDNVVIYAREDLQLTASQASGGDWADFETTTANATLVDGVVLPADFAGGHYTYAAGVFARTAAGNAAAAAAQQKTIADFTEQVSDAVQIRLDNFALTREYDNMLSACTYATSSVPQFAAEGQYCVNARDATFAKLYEIRNDILAGLRPLPSLEQLLSELPALVWPA